MVKMTTTPTQQFTKLPDYQCDDTITNYHVGNVVEAALSHEDLFAFETRIMSRDFVIGVIQKLFHHNFELKHTLHFKEYRFQNYIVRVSSDNNQTTTVVSVSPLTGSITVINDNLLMKDILCIKTPETQKQQVHEIEIPFEFASEEFVEHFEYEHPAFGQVFIEKRSEPHHTKYYQITLTTHESPHIILQELFGVPTDSITLNAQ